MSSVEAGHLFTEICGSKLYREANFVWLFRRSASEFPEVSLGMWDFAADYYAANMTAQQRAVADRNGFPQKIPELDKRNDGVAGAVIHAL